MHTIYPIHPIVVTNLIYFGRLPTSCMGVRCVRIFVVAGGIPIYIKCRPTSWVDVLYPRDLYSNEQAALGE